VTLKGEWTFPDQHRSGTIELFGNSANGGRDLIGELTYVDGCTDHRLKPGTFAVRR
jgi:hypothetical protein